MFAVVTPLNQLYQIDYLLLLNLKSALAETGNLDVQSTFICLYVCLYVCMYDCMYVCDVCIYVFMYV